MKKTLTQQNLKLKEELEVSKKKNIKIYDELHKERNAKTELKRDFYDLKSENKNLKDKIVEEYFLNTKSYRTDKTLTQELISVVIDIAPSIIKKLMQEEKRAAAAISTKPLCHDFIKDVK